MFRRYFNAYLWRRYTASLSMDKEQMEYQRCSVEMRALAAGGVLVLAALIIGGLLITGGAP